MNFRDDYKLLSGWIHNYYCDKDGAELIFDINNNDYFKCPICNRKYDDEKRKNAWVIKYRYKIFETLEKYSEEYLIKKNDKYLKFIENALSYYSSNYDNFLIHDKDGNIFDDYVNKSNKCGKITAQGLNEAMISIQMVNCISNVEKYLRKDIKYEVFNKLFKEIFKLLSPQINKIHNINCYEVCAIGMMGIISKNNEMIDFAFNSPYSFYKQLDNGTTSDYFWFEGSFHYHLFVLKPILELLRIAQKYNYDVPQRYYEISKHMLIQSYKSSFNDCSLPSPNDGWPNRSLLNYLQIYKLGNEIFKGAFSDIIKSINDKKNIYNITMHCIDSGFSNLKNYYVNIFIKYKNNDFIHAHPDKLNIEIKCGNAFLTHDLSTSGYGSNISKKYYKKTYAHNTIIIDGDDQNLECKSIVRLADGNTIDVKIENIYNNVNASRKIQLSPNIINDQIFVEYMGNKNVDYIFHCDAKLITEVSYKDIESFKEYPYFKNFKEVDYQDYIVLKWQLDNKMILNKIDLNDKKLFICESPDNPGTHNRTTLIIRASKGNDISFNTIWEFL